MTLLQSLSDYTASSMSILGLWWPFPTRASCSVLCMTVLLSLLLRSQGLQTYPARFCPVSVGLSTVKIPEAKDLDEPISDS